MEHVEDQSSAAIAGDEASSENSSAKLAVVETASATEPAASVAGDACLPPTLASSHPAEGYNPASDAVAVPTSHPVSEPEVDFSRLDMDAEQLVASLFGDEDSSISFEQPPADDKKGFVSPDHEDAAKWFYQDPQGVIQGE